jgi:hypothetical protein
MKIAVCVSGGVRYPHLGLNSIQKIIPNKNIKVFIHTWRITNINSFLDTVAGIGYKEIDKVIETNLFSLETYNYEKLLIENYDECQNKFQNLLDNLKFIPSIDIEDIEPRSDVGPISMHYSIYKANELKKEYEKENNIKFDWVIRMRTDSDFRYERLDLNTLNHELNIPSGEDWGDHSINDQFAIGTSYAMDLYSSLYNNFHYTQSSKFYPERILALHLKNMNLIPNRIDFLVRINNGIDFRKVWYPHLVE